MRDAIREADTPIYIAVLPESAADVAGGDPAEVARQLSQAVGRPGTYGVVVGDSFRAGSSELPSGEAGQLATDALDSGGDDTTVRPRRLRGTRGRGCRRRGVRQRRQ